MDKRMREHWENDIIFRVVVQLTIWSWTGALIMLPVFGRDFAAGFGLAVPVTVGVLNVVWKLFERNG